jgi:hypothetical protein
MVIDDLVVKYIEVRSKFFLTKLSTHPLFHFLRSRPRQVSPSLAPTPSLPSFKGIRTRGKQLNAIRDRSSKK